MNNGYVKSIVSKVETQEPDMIVITGDTLHANVEYLEDTPVEDLLLDLLVISHRHML